MGAAIGAFVVVAFAYDVAVDPEWIQGDALPLPLYIPAALPVAFAIRVTVIRVDVYADSLAVRNNFWTWTVRREEIDSISLERQDWYRQVVTLLHEGRRIVPDVIRSNRRVPLPLTEPAADQLCAWLAAG